MEQLLPFLPENDLDEIIIRARNQIIEIDELLKKIFTYNLFVPSSENPLDDESRLAPLFLGTPSKPLIAAYSSASRSRLYINRAPFSLKIAGRELISRLPEGYGIILNPGYITQLVLSCDALSDLKRDWKEWE